MTHSHTLKRGVSKEEYLKDLHEKYPSHWFFWWREGSLECCIKCGIVRQRSKDYSKSTCRGWVEVTLRGNSVLPPTAKAEGIRTQEL